MTGKRAILQRAPVRWCAFTVALGALLFIPPLSGPARAAESDPLAPRLKPPPHWQWRYKKARLAVDRERQALAKRYMHARTLREKQAVLRRAGRRLTRLMTRTLIPFWYGTPWTIRGATIQPRVGSIACGTFVATLLHQAGFRVERDKLGAQNSPQLMKTLTDARYMTLTWGWSIKRFLGMVRRKGRGLYVVGLDMHVGYLLVTGSRRHAKRRRVWFIHANPYDPAQVVRRRAHKDDLLVESRYRLVAHLSADPRLLEAWIFGQPLPTWRRPRKRRWTSPTRPADAGCVGHLKHALP